MRTLSDFNDTIMALATPPGVGAIGVIRVSGSLAIEMVNQLFPSKNLLQQPSHTLHVGLLEYQQELLDEVVVALYKNPRSYTGENVVEISTHGSAFIQQKIMEVLAQLGCRTALPGEFTQRAFLNGKMDLAQAEAVADVIASNTAASRNTALNAIRGGFSKELNQLREQLIQFAALIELELDFATEDVEFANRTQFKELLQQLQIITQQLIHSFKLGNVIKNGVQVAIIGKPNAGKSTLLNALLNEERAIVSDIAGTTRDTIEEILNIEGVLFRLIDTAGIRNHTTDSIESMGIEKSLEKMQQANLVMYLFDAHSITPAELKEDLLTLDALQKPYLLVANKADLPSQLMLPNNSISIAAKNKTGIATLKQALVQAAIGSQLNTEHIVVTNQRHHQALQQLNEALAEVETALNLHLPGDLLAPDLRRCLYYLGTITGEVEIDRDILGTIFGKFCIGK
jgi:tRNA modification GTPase